MRDLEHGNNLEVEFYFYTKVSRFYAFIRQTTSNTELSENTPNYARKYA